LPNALRKKESGKKRILLTGVQIRKKKVAKLIASGKIASGTEEGEPVTTSRDRESEIRSLRRSGKWKKIASFYTGGDASSKKI